MMKTIAVDDEPLALELIETFSRRFDFLQYEKSFTNTAVALQHVERHVVDLLFLDIRMPAISGVDFYKTLPYKPLLIFTTSYSDYAIESYELDAVDYLLKPFTPARFEMAVRKARDRYNLLHKATAPDDAKYLLLRVDYGVVKVMLGDILFVEGLDNYLKIHLQGAAPIVVRLTMKALMEKLPPQAFVRVHRSFIVPLARIQTVKNRLIAIGAEEIPVGKAYEDNLKEILNGK